MSQKTVRIWLLKVFYYVFLLFSSFFTLFRNVILLVNLSIYMFCKFFCIHSVSSRIDQLYIFLRYPIIVMLSWVMIVCNIFLRSMFPKSSHWVFRSDSFWPFDAFTLLTWVLYADYVIILTSVDITVGIRFVISVCRSLSV